MRNDNVKGHMQVHVKYSNESPQSTQDMCRNLLLEIVDKVVDPVEESSRVKQKHEEVTGEVQATIDEETLEQSALKIQWEWEKPVEK